jgi:hypothetical protein
MVTVSTSPVACRAIERGAPPRQLTWRSCAVVVASRTLSQCTTSSSMIRRPGPSSPTWPRPSRSSAAAPGVAVPAVTIHSGCGASKVQLRESGARVPGADGATLVHVKSRCTTP